MSGRDRRPDVSIIICTHNRCSELDAAIASVIAPAAASVRYELIVVDNNSSDATPQVVARHATAHSGIRYVREGRLGLSIARNAGWQSATAPIVAFLDDDAVVEPGWIDAIADAFGRGPAGIAMVGGRVIPQWEVPQPSWLADRPALGLTMLDWSPTAREIVDLRLEWLAGANMAVAREMLQRVGGFHPALGRSGRRQLSSEDVFLQKRVQQLGGRLLYDPAMAVSHRVPASRVTQAWFRRRYFWQGVSDAVMQILEEEPSVVERLSHAAARTRALLRRGRALPDLLRRQTDPARFEQVCWMWIECGHIVGLLGAGRV